MLPSTAITRTELSATFSEFDLAMSRKGFIGPRVLKPRLVGVQAADVGKIPIEALLQTQDDSRAPGAGYKGDDVEFSKFSYATDEHGRKVALDDRQIAMFRDIIDAEEIHTQRAIDQVLRNYEIAVATAIYDTAVWTGAALTTAITHEWDDATNAVPITDIDAARQKILDGSGLDPNALILNRKQYLAACRTGQIEDLIKYAGRDDPKSIARQGQQILAAAFDLDFILVAGGVYNASNEGQDASLSAVWSDEYMMLARVAVTDDPQEPCIGRTFLWTGDGPVAPGSDEELALIVEEYREEGVRGSVIRARNDRDIKIMYPQAGHLLSNAITI